MVTTDTAKMSVTDMAKEYHKLTGKSMDTTNRTTVSKKLKNARVLASSDGKLKTKTKIAKAKTAKAKTAKKGATVGTKVKVGTTSYPSVTKACKELKLFVGSIGKLRRFRKELNTNGKATVDGHKFTLVK